MQSTDELRARTMERLAAGKIALPLLPQVASQVVMLAGDPQADAARLSALIHRDPALAAQVLRIANSAAYRPRMPIVSLQQAVARLGLDVVTEIAFTASLQSGVFKVPGYESELKLLWRHAIASGVYAKEIARVRRSNVESAFLCGLLHAVGKPALLQLIADIERHDERRAGWPLVEPLLDELHTPVGTDVATAWGLPRPVAIAIQYYGAYGDAPALAQDAMITCLADRFATALIQPERFDEATLLEHPIFADLNLYPDDVARLREKQSMVAAIVESMTS